MIVRDCVFIFSGCLLDAWGNGKISKTIFSSKLQPLSIRNCTRFWLAGRGLDLCKGGAWGLEIRTTLRGRSGLIPPLLDNWTFGLFFRRRASLSSLALPPWVALGLPPRPAPKSLRQKIQFSQRGGISPVPASSPDWVVATGRRRIPARPSISRAGRGRGRGASRSGCGFRRYRCRGRRVRGVRPRGIR
jgi:hypothetical protein